MKLDVSGIFSIVLLIVGGGELMTIGDPSLSVHVLLIVGGGELITIKDPLLSVHGYQLLPLATS